MQSRPLGVPSRCIEWGRDAGSLSSKTAQKQDSSAWIELADHYPHPARLRLAQFVKSPGKDRGEGTPVQFVHAREGAFGMQRQVPWIARLDPCSQSR